MRYLGSKEARERNPGLTQIYTMDTDIVGEVAEAASPTILIYSLIKLVLRVEVAGGAGSS